MPVDRAAFRDRVLADIIAAPLRDPAAYRAASVLAQLEETERYVRQCATLHRDDLFANDDDANTAIHEASALWRSLSRSASNPYRVTTCLSRVARSLLQPIGRSMVLRVCKRDPGREILRWRHISLMLPPAILIAAATEENLTPAPAVRLLNRSLAPDGNVAELHVHHAAIISFEAVWAVLHRTAVVTPDRLRQRLADKRARCPGLHSERCPNARPTANSVAMKHMAEWADLLRQAFIARYILHKHSWHKGVELRDCSECNAAPWRNALHHFSRGLVRPYNLAPTPYPWQDHRVALNRRWRNTGSLAKPTVETHSSVIRGEVADEQLFLCRAFAYIRCQGLDVVDTGFEALLLQYLRVKTAVFRMLVHAPGEHGLEQFRAHFSQIKIYAPEAESILPDSPSGPDLTIAAVEYRVATDAWLRQLRRKESTIQADIVQLRERESAWLIHLKREAPDDGLPLFASAVQRLEKDGERIKCTITTQPKALRELRGLDIAGVESDQPLWVAVETLRCVRRRSQEVAARDSRRGIFPLGLTLHVGEDFTWLTSGVRAVAEPLHWDLLLRGDRLGHAIAITIDPTKWCQRKVRQTVSLKRLERLLDLAFLAEYAERHAHQEEEWLAAEMRKSVCAIWGDAERVHSDKDLILHVCSLWTLLGTRTARILLKQRLGSFHSVAEKWLSMYLWNRSTQRSAHQVENLTIEESVELDLLKVARKRVIHELARLQICVESNPSSNLIVGSLESVAAQDFLHRRPTANAEPGDETLTWTISTDDPITFSTTLADEYAYAWAGLVLRQENPCDPAYARALLDEAAATSMRMRFTIPQDDRKATSRDKRKGRDHARGY